MTYSLINCCICFSPAERLKKWKLVMIYLLANSHFHIPARTMAGDHEVGESRNQTP